MSNNKQAFGCLCSHSTTEENGPGHNGLRGSLLDPKSTLAHVYAHNLWSHYFPAPIYLLTVFSPDLQPHAANAF
eukprot:1146916-Pelagomonas_calceolata.AAC.8